MIRAMSAAGVGEGGLIGRDDEMERAMRALDNSVNVLVTSGPGFGRTSFALHAAGSARRPVRFVRADVASRAIPFGALASFVSTAGEPLGDGPDAVSLAVQRLAPHPSGPQPVLVVDDAPHLDTHSALALAQATDVGAVLMLTARHGSSLPPPLSVLRGGGRMVEIDLGPISGSAVGAVATWVLGGPVEPAMVRALSRLTGGAPAAIVESLRAARDAGTVEQFGRLWRQVGPLSPPSTVVAYVSTVTEGLRRGELEALDVTVLGASVPYEPLVLLAGASSVEALEDLGLVESVDVGGRPYVRAADPLVRWVRLERMSLSRRRRLAGRFRAQLHAMPAAVSAEDPTRDLLGVSLALRAGEVLNGDDALAAARRAKQEGELELAEHLCRAVVEPGAHPEVVILLAELLTGSGRNLEAEQVLDGLDVQRPDEVALVAMTRAVNLGFHLGEVDAAVTVLTEAIAQLGDEPWAAELIGLRGVIELMLGAPHLALARVEPFLTPASGRTFVEAATAAGPALVMIGRPLDAADIAQQAFEERVRLGDQPMLSSPGLHALVRSMGLAEAGRFDEADQLSAFVMAVASERGERDGEMWAGVIGGRSLLDQGRYAEALLSFEIAAAAATDLNMVPHLRWARGGALLAAAQTGDTAGARRALGALDACPPTPLELMASELERARAWAAIVDHDVRSGVEQLCAAADAARSTAQPGLEILALHDLVRLGRTERATRLVEVAAEVQGDLSVMRAAHATALAADDASALEDVAERFEALGAIVLAAEAANQASWSFRRAGARSPAERARAMMLRLRSARPEAATPALHHAPGMAWLTAREREVAALAAGGYSSKDIASRLGVSVRTVDNLLQRVYRKLDVSGRDALRSDRFADRSVGRGS
jgi:DNA-binding CsgD family transcriptional regulator/tetratricopeptide (TPR) repeat protein